MASVQGHGSQPAIPRLSTTQLAKISIANVHGDQASPRWTHLKERDDLVIALDLVRVPGSSQLYVEHHILRVLCGADLLVSLDLDERLEDPSMDAFRHYGSQIPLDQLPLGVLVRPPNLRITYALDSFQKKMLQLKFRSTSDCQDVAASLERMGLPVRAGVLLDRPGSQRLNTAESWSGTPPSSQQRTVWSSHGSSSSQTTVARDSALSMNRVPFSSQPRRAPLNLERPHTSKTMLGSSLPNALANSLERLPDLPKPSSSGEWSVQRRAIGLEERLLTPTGRQNLYSRQEHSDSALGSSPSGKFSRPVEGIATSYMACSGNNDFRSLLPRQSLGILDNNSVLPRVQIGASAVPSTAYSMLPVRPEQSLSSNQSFLFRGQSSVPSPQMAQRPPTSIMDGLMPPPCGTGRILSSHETRTSHGRKWNEPSRPPSRRSDRIAAKSSIYPSPEFSQHFNTFTTPSPTRPKGPAQPLELPPKRDLPFHSPTSATQSPSAKDSSASSSTNNQMEAPTEKQPAKPKTARKPRKTLAKPAQPRKRAAPKRAKATAGKPPIGKEKEQEQEQLDSSPKRLCVSASQHDATAPMPTPEQQLQVEPAPLVTSQHAPDPFVERDPTEVETMAGSASPPPPPPPPASHCSNHLEPETQTQTQPDTQTRTLQGDVGQAYITKQDAETIVDGKLKAVVGACLSEMLPALRRIGKDIEEMASTAERFSGMSPEIA